MATKRSHANKYCEKRRMTQTRLDIKYQGFEIRRRLKRLWRQMVSFQRAIHNANEPPPRPFFRRAITTTSPINNQPPGPLTISPNLNTTSPAQTAKMLLSKITPFLLALSASATPRHPNSLDPRGPDVLEKKPTVFYNFWNVLNGAHDIFKRPTPSYTVKKIDDGWLPHHCHPDTTTLPSKCPVKDIEAYEVFYSDVRHSLYMYQPARTTINPKITPK